MSRLDLIFKRNTIGGSGRVDIEGVKQETKILMLDIFIKAMEADGYKEMGEVLRKEVGEL